MQRIHLLNSRFANQIAAGEVVERPASVVKELLENSLDAKAKHISVELVQGGLQQIRIRDDGLGIHPDDLPLALSRHATSKVRELADLEHLTSLGFRGEALASISSVSQLLLSSAMADQDTGWQVRAEGADMQMEVRPVAHPPGTTIEVNNLFFNTPARRKFLRSAQTEFSYADEVVRRVALANFEVGITLQHQQRTILRLPIAASDMARTRRIAQVCGAAFIKQALAFDTQAAGLRLWGWLGLPSAAKSQANLQYCYVNGRIVRDKIINHALRQAYDGLLYPGRYAAYVLYLEIDPQQVDVNVHPTKHEVRFRDSRWVHDFLVASVKKVLQGETTLLGDREEVTRLSYQPELESLAIKPLPAVLESQANALGTSPTPVPLALNEPSTDLGKVIGLLHHQYLLVENASGLMIISVIKAQQQLLYQQLNMAWQQDKRLSIQPLLIPTRLEFSQKEADRIEAQALQLEPLGIRLSRIGDTTLLIREIPSLLRQAELAMWLPAVLTAFVQGVTLAELTLSELLSALLVIMAERGVPMTTSFSLTDANALLRALESLPNAMQSGAQLTLSELATMTQTALPTSNLR